MLTHGTPYMPAQQPCINETELSSVSSLGRQIIGIFDIIEHHLHIWSTFDLHTLCASFLPLRTQIMVRFNYLTVHKLYCKMPLWLVITTYFDHSHDQMCVCSLGKDREKGNILLERKSNKNRTEQEQECTEIAASIFSPPFFPSLLLPLFFITNETNYTMN